jgi:hypothetical protein
LLLQEIRGKLMSTSSGSTPNQEVMCIRNVDELLSDLWREIHKVVCLHIEPRGNFTYCLKTVLSSRKVTAFYLCFYSKKNELAWVGGTRWRSDWGTALQTGSSGESIPDGVIGIFHWHNPSGRTMTLGSSQPLIEMSTRNITWGKGGRCVGLITLPPSCADCLKIWEPQPPGTLRACQGL